MKKLLVVLFLVIGAMFSTISPLAEEKAEVVEIEDEQTPEAYRRKNEQDLIVKFAIFSGFVIVVGAIVISYRNKKAFNLYATEMNDDGSFTITVRSREIKKMIQNPDDVHVIIRRGSCIFLKKLDFSNTKLTKNDDLFVAVVNRKSIIEFIYKDESLVVDGEKIQSSTVK
ncbi:hypothetical protein [Anaerorhabdus furcosa]|uniref:Uncharacterized protein n=1 Tax=Anaerorhabdus furcosa TaxID=118967 RepID=A0A1T4JZ27_9FIRM|nr:hypothetical protein [Anaerorhabdus furcosa]SJZ35384.1 hypothetical protein SAMN02745191_0182 [Anaerorhabdus furcosa]